MDNTQVPVTEGGVDNSTSAGGVATPATPIPQPQDANQVDPRQEYEASLRKAQEDINRMKSTFQRKEAERERQWKEQEAEYRRQLEEVRLSNMDEEQRKVYEQTSYQRKLQETQRTLEETTARLASIQAMRDAERWFVEQGVPVNSLVRDADYETLWTSGMEWITAELQKSRNPTSPPSAPAPKPAPSVDTQSGSPAYTGNTWVDLVKRYGSEDNVYRLIETGQLPASILPGLQ